MRIHSLSSRLCHIPKWAGNNISRAHVNTNIFITFATAVFATSGQRFARLQIALGMSQGRGVAGSQTRFVTNQLGFGYFYATGNHTPEAWLLLPLGGRPAGVLLGRPPIPSSLVPNELVDQCMAVLQGKSRSLIIRELQRTVSTWLLILTLDRWIAS